MGNVTILLSLGIFGFMLLFLFFKLRSDNSENGQDHFLLQLLILGFVLGVFLLIGKVSLDDKDNCAWNVVNSTLTGATNVYVYDYQCSTNTKATSNDFYNLITWLIRCIVIYVFLYFFYDLLKRFGMFGGKKRGEA